MGLFDGWKKHKESKKTQTYAKMLNGYLPIFSQFGDDIYASDVVQQALYAIVTEMKKLSPRHDRLQGSDPIPVDDEIQRVLDNPNPYMTTSDLIEKETWNLLLNCNSFTYVMRNKNEQVIGLYPLQPVYVEFLTDSRQVMYIKLKFKSDYEITVPYGSIIHQKTHFFKCDFMGGNENGQPDNKGILKVLKLNDTLLEGIGKALNMSYAVNGIVKYNTMLNEDKMEPKIAEFEQKLRNNESGLIGMDSKAEFVNLKRDLAIVDEATLRFIDDKILRNYGVPVCIVRGDYTVDQYQSFYQKTLEHLIISKSQVYTKTIFTDRQNTGFKNNITFYPAALAFMSMNQTLAMVNLLGQSGALYENEKRIAFGYAPDKDLVGVRQKSLNYVDVAIANEYQLKTANQNKKSEVQNDD